jgi:diaminopimelate decarboxylase
MHKMTWETPRIAPVELQSLNSFGRRRSRADSQSEIDGVPLATLVERYGSPLYVTSEQRLRANIRRIRQAFTARYAQVIHGWSYKTNYNGAVCSILHQEGSWAEVVSRFEYEKARALGVPGEHIVFNGPNKQRPILERAIAEGALIHVDHADELALIESIGEERRECVPVTLRLNFETGYSEPWSRFGFNLESGAARAAIIKVKTSAHLRMNGLHCHIGTFILDPRAYAAAVTTLCTLAAGDRSRRHAPELPRYWRRTAVLQRPARHLPAARAGHAGYRGICRSHLQCFPGRNGLPTRAR